MAERKAGKGPIRVLLVDDSPSVRAMLRAMLEADPGIRVVGEAGDGKQAIAMTKALQPNVVTMDLQMPVMGGLEAIGEIMADAAVPILVVSGQADAGQAYAAISSGALDVMSKQDLGQGPPLVAKVKLLAGVRVITHVRARPQPLPLPPPAKKPGDESFALVFAIAASTGGPQALAEVLAALPSEFPSPVLVAQHISAGFAAGLAEWLDLQCPLPVRLARDGDTLQPGVVFISPSEHNLAVARGGRLQLEPGDPSQIYHPSCDRLLSSLADAYGKRSVGVILTGMGSDGVAGIARIAQAGGLTLAQDQVSSVVFGMNAEAIRRGHAREVLALGELAKRMCGLAAAADRLVA